MNPLIQLKKATPIFLGVFVLVCLMLSPRVQAVVPPPDGGYALFNTAEGQNALFSLNTGQGNTAVGWSALYSNVDGGFNTATGAGALLFNTSNNNTAFGAAALLFNTTGSGNTAVGTAALLNNVGSTVDMPNGGPGSFSTAVGFRALTSNTTGSFNTAIGENALPDNTDGNNNTALGAAALFRNTSGTSNTAVGPSALLQHTSGHTNTALGSLAGAANMTGSSNVYIGPVSGVADESYTCYIGSIYGRPTTNGVPVLISGSEKLGTSTSSKRFKEDIKPMDKTSEAILGLKPVTFRYKKEIDSAGTSQFGLVAEEVEKVNPDLVVRDKEGRPYSVRYDQVNAMLLNEFLKEHRKVAELERTVAQQRKDFETTLAQLKAQVQKVSAQIEASKPAPQVANNP